MNSERYIANTLILANISELASETIKYLDQSLLPDLSEVKIKELINAELTRFSRMQSNDNKTAASED